VANEIKLRAILEDKVSAPLHSIRNEFDKLTGTKGSGSLFGNVSSKAIAKGFKLVDDAASAVVGVLGDAVQAAIEDEQSQRKLATSLMANIPAWDGNTSAIEKVLQARIKLGFSDESQRESLSLLVAATHDVNKALDVQRTAMDLARFKGISLMDATEALTKVEAGRYRILASLGIQLKAGATAQDALTAVQRVATGQAEDYATTTGGKLVVAQTRMNEKLEELGYKLLPVVTTAIDVLSLALDDLDTSTKGQAEQSDFLGSKTSLLGGAIHGLADGVQQIIPTLDSMMHGTKLAGNAAVDATGSLDGLLGSIRPLPPAFGSVGDAASEGFDLMRRKSGYAAREINKHNTEILTSVKDLRKGFADEALGLIQDFYDPIEQRDKLIANNAELAAQKRILASSTATTAERRDARASIHQIEDDSLQLRVKLLEVGKLSKAEQQTLLADLRAKLQTSSGAARTALQGIIDKVIALGRLTVPGFHVNVVYSGKGLSPKGARASGGPVTAGQAYTVGEEGPETLVLGNQSGVVLPNGTRTGGGGVTVYVNFTSLGPPTPADGQRIAESIGPAIERWRRQKRIA
jgi:hypothetical protein